LGIDHDHLLVRADGEQPVGLRIHGESRRFLAMREWPVGEYLVRFAVHRHDLSFVFDGNEEVTMVARRERFWLASNRYRRDYLAGGDIDPAHTVIVAVARIDALELAHIQNNVRVRAAGLDRADCLQCVAVHHCDRVGTAIGNETQLALLDERESMLLRRLCAMSEGGL
jgi:hypothetical protein